MILNGVMADILRYSRPGRVLDVTRCLLVLVAVYDVDIKAKDIRSSRFNFKV